LAFVAAFFFVVFFLAILRSLPPDYRPRTPEPRVQNAGSL